jgi:putative addiction module component (TIGR02574 family)
MSVDISHLRDLPVGEKLRIVTQLWDDIAASSEPIVVPPDVLREASRRSAELKADRSLAINDEELGGESMASTRHYHPLVADDLAAAVAHYDDISVDLGNRFRVSVRNRIDTVLERPESFGRIHE